MNGHPGPAHVIELADVLVLTTEQREAAASIRLEMEAAAKALGARIIEQERELERRFAGRHAQSADVARRTAEIAALWGELRAVHLEAHLRMTRLLTPGQIAAYVAARGHGDGAPDAATPRHAP